MLNVDQSQRRDIDTTLDDRLTLAIDEENIGDNPYIFEPSSFVGNNWFKQGNNIVKLNLAEQDSLIFLSSPLVKLAQKDITNVIVSFDYNISNVSVNYPILSNISLTCMEMTNYMLVENILTTQGHIDVDCSLFNFSSNVVNTSISEQGFKVGINFNGNKSNATIKLSNVQIQFKYNNKLSTQEDSVVNRLEPHIDFYRDEDGDLVLQIGGDASGKGMDHSGGDIDTYSKTEIDNKLATKVNAEVGKGLSSNDYTLTEKTKLASVETNANYYVHPSSHQTGMITESSALTNLETSENATQHEINLAIDSKINSGGGSVDWSDIENKPLDYPPSSHNHDDRYYTESEIDTALNSKADVNSLSIVAISGDYDDLIDKPTIPSKTSDLTNDGDGTNAFLTQHQSLTNYIQKSSTSGLIKNNGTIKQKIGDITIDGAYDNIYPNNFAQDSQGVDRILFADASDNENIRACEYLPSYVIKDSNAHSHIGSSANANQSVINSAIDTALSGKSDVSHNHDDRYYTESEVDTALNGKQATLISGTNIKTVNNQSLLGSGNIVIQGGGTGVDIATSWGNPTSDSKVPSEKLAKDTFDGKANVSHTHTKSEITDFPSIPSKTSDLNNDSGFITSSSLPTKVSDLQNDSGFITSSALPTKTSDLTNDGADGTNVFVANNDSRLSDARTPTSHTHTSNQVTDLINTIYPVGSIYMSVSNTSPSILFGGTWEQIQDKFLLASGQTYQSGSTGGEATHTLTTDEMPSHTHTQNSHTHNPSSIGGNWVPKTQTIERSRFSTSSSGNKYAPASNSANDWVWGETGSTTATNQNSGGGQAHNNMPPYLVVNVWKRTA